MDATGFRGKLRTKARGVAWHELVSTPPRSADDVPNWKVPMDDNRDAQSGLNKAHQQGYAVNDVGQWYLDLQKQQRDRNKRRGPLPPDENVLGQIWWGTIIASGFFGGIGFGKVAVAWIESLNASWSFPYMDIAIGWPFFLIALAFFWSGSQVRAELFVHWVANKNKDYVKTVLFKKMKIVFILGTIVRATFVVSWVYCAFAHAFIEVEDRYYMTVVTMVASIAVVVEFRSLCIGQRKQGTA